MIPLMLMTPRFGKRVGKMFLDVDHALGELIFAPAGKRQRGAGGARLHPRKARDAALSQPNRVLLQNQLQVVKEMARVMPTPTCWSVSARC
jgi:hypothetical protein